MIFSPSLHAAGKIVRAILISTTIFALAIAGLFLYKAAVYAATPAEEGEAIFNQKCSGCHTIGGGRAVGPDLKGITAKRDTDWLVKFITTPDKLIAQGDPIATEIVKEYGMSMPNMGVSEDDAEAILAYLEAQSGGGQPVATPVTPQPIAATAGNAEAGKDLFTGKLAMKNGGPACLSCHNISGVGTIGGGTMAKDLTASFSTLGEAGINSVLKATPFPVMKDIYPSKPLTDEEIADITAFMKSAGSAPAGASQNPAIYFVIGGMASVIIIVLLHLFWRGRISGVRRSLVKGGSR